MARNVVTVDSARLGSISITPDTTYFVTDDSSFNYNTNIAVTKFVTLDNLQEYDKKLKEYIQDKLGITEEERKNDYYKRVL